MRKIVPDNWNTYCDGKEGTVMGRMGTVMGRRGQ